MLYHHLSGLLYTCRPFLHLDLGMSAKEIANKLNVSKKLIYDYLHRYNIPIKPQGTRSNRTSEYIAQPDLVLPSKPTTTRGRIMESLEIKKASEDAFFIYFFIRFIPLILS